MSYQMPQNGHDQTNGYIPKQYMNGQDYYESNNQSMDEPDQSNTPTSSNQFNQINKIPSQNHVFNNNLPKSNSSTINAQFSQSLIPNPPAPPPPPPPPVEPQNHHNV